MSARKSRPKPGRLQARELTDDNNTSTLLSPTLSSPPAPNPSPSPPPPFQPATSDVFEIEDFSMATGWERLIRQVEERMVEWRIDHGKLGRKRVVSGSGGGSEEKVEQEVAAAGDSEKRCELHYNNKTFTLVCRLAAPTSSSIAAASAYLPTSPTQPFSPASLPPLSLYLGLPSYLLLSPSPPRRVSRNESALLLSTLTLAASAVACPLPLLAPFGLPQQHQFQGRTAVGEGWQFHVRSSEAVVERVRWLSGLEEWWEGQRRRQKDRVSECGMAPSSATDVTAYTASEQLTVTALHTFHLTSSYSPSSYPSTTDVCTWRDTSLDAQTSYGVPWGPITDPLAALSLTAVWHATNSSFTETASYSELDALVAPEWRLTVTWREEVHDSDSAAYVEALKALVELGQRAKQTKSLADVMGTTESTTAAAAGTGGSVLSTPQKQRGMSKSSSFSSPSPTQAAASSSSSSPTSASRASPSAFTAIKAVQSSLQAHIESAHLNAMYGEPLSHDYVDGVMKQLMDIQPDEVKRKQLSYSPTHSTTSAATYCDPVRAACPYGSLLSLLVCQLLQLHGRVGSTLSVRAVAHFWLEFVQELRYHFEAGLVLPHMAAGDGESDGSGGVSGGGGGGGGMDYNGCVVWQKMQVLQQCIIVSRQRQQWHKDNYSDTAAATNIFNQATVVSTEAKRAADDELTDGWQEFDLLPVTPTAEKKQKHDSETMETEEEEKELGEVSMKEEEDEEDEEEAVPTLTPQQAAQQSRGASDALPSHSLLCIDRPLLVPHTQPSPLLTTDQLDQQADLYARLPQDETVEAMRREAQEAGLRSDMSAFKAANPACVMEDFVRWHSPRDWTASSSGDDVRGVLSERMRYKGNRWRKLWQESSSVPAWEQLPLFDPLVTGERVLSELEHVDPTSLFAQLTAVAVCNWMSAMARTPPVVSSIGDVRQRLTDTHGWLRTLPSPSQPAVAGMWSELTSVELLCARITSLLYCFPTCLSLIDRLLVSPHYATISTADERDAVLSLFTVTERNIHANKAGQAATVQKMPRADVRQYVLHASSGERRDGVGEWLYAQVEEREDERVVAAQSSYSMKDVKEGRMGGVAAVGSRRLKRGRGGVRRVVVRSMDDGEGGDEAEDELPVFVLATSLLTHWPLT